MRDKSNLEIKDGMYYWRIIAVLLPVYLSLIDKADVFCILHSKHFFLEKSKKILTFNRSPYNLLHYTSF